MAYSSHDLTDTIVALATPQGVGALGIIRLSGQQAIEIVNELFPSKDLSKTPSHTVHFGSIRDEKGAVIDEVLVSLFVAPSSYTGENVVEISCHGSDYIIQQLILLFTRRGARLAQPGEFTMRAFLNGQMDLSQAEAVADLIASTSEGSHQLAIQQMRGGFSDEIQALRQQLIDFASLIELELDFSEEDVEFANRDDLRKLVLRIQKVLGELIHSFQLGNVLKQGVITVIAGRPNAGKSTLLNALLNENRAIVSDIAGTTRDTIEEVLNINGVQFRLIDTAGLRNTEDSIEAIGVERTLEKVKQSKLLVYVFDVVKTSPEEVRADIEELQEEGMHVLLVANKMDLNPYTTYEHYFPEGSLPEDTLLSAESWVPVIAKESMNIPHLKEKLYQAILLEKINPDNTIVSNARHYQALEKAYASLGDVLKSMDSEVTSDFMAMDIRLALHHLGEITGEISTDDLLGNIFGKFCIGK